MTVRRPRLAAALTALALAAVAALTLSPIAKADAQDFTSGGGKFNFGIGFGKANFTGHGTPTDAHGQIHIDIEGTLFESLKGKVDCVNVAGNTATISGELDEAPAASPTLRYFLLSARDNSNPGETPPDQVDAVLSAAPQSCLVPFGLFSPIEQGNVIVKDR